MLRLAASRSARFVPRAATRGLSSQATSIQNDGSSFNKVAAVTAAVLVAAAAANDVSGNTACNDSVKLDAAIIHDDTNEYQRKSTNLPTFSLEKFRAGVDDRIWVAMDGGVYDVTPFLDAHPGGVSRIMMVQGQDLAKFWGVYQLHDRPHIRALLEEYRIGNLSTDDYNTVKRETEFTSMYVNDPVRPAAQAGKLRIPSEHPWNSEPKDLKYLVDSFLTPNDVFFVRNHNAVPDIKEKDYVLEIEENEAAGIKAKTFTLADLKKLPKHTVISALQCAGNRQEDYVTEDRPLFVAPHWRNGAIGNAKWTGVKVRDILRECGMDVDAIALGHKDANSKIANFIGTDTDETGVPYAGVIPVEKVMDPHGDAILAYEMNDETLPRDHGFPVRLLAPGHAGCRNVKWVSAIALTEEASELDSGSRLDRHFSPDISWLAHKEHTALDRCPERKGCVPCAERVREDQGPVIQTLPVQSVICVPGNRTTISSNNDSIDVKGIAWSGAGRGIVRVEVSVDNGKTFTAADLIRSAKGTSPPPEFGMGRNHAWTQWSIKVPYCELPKEIQDKVDSGEQTDLEICCKAIDGDLNSQPENMSVGWNVLGICINHWSRVQIKLSKDLADGEIRHAPNTPKPGSPFWGDGTPNKP